MRIAYVLSRFPHLSETFIVREFDALAGREDIDVELFSLFPAAAGPVQPVAQPWVSRLRRANARTALTGLLFWTARRPLTLGRVLIVVAAAHRRRPGRAARALVTVVLAAGHARTMRTLGVNHVHAHYATYPTLTAWVVRRLAGIPYTFTAHAHDIYVDQSLLEVKVKEAEAVVTISDFNRGFLWPYGAGRARRVEVVRYGIDVGRFAYQERTLPADGPVRLLCVASLQEYKGHRYLIEALAQSPTLERVSVDLVGGGHLDGELRRLAAELGVGDRVRFHGALPEPRVLELLNASDGFVLPSIVAGDGQMEGLPNVLIEALAVGVPVVSTRISGIPELIRDGDTGLLAEAADAGSLARALERLLADPGDARRRSRAGRQLVERDYELRRAADQMARLLGELALA
ncbi:MAG TPA: glycosyltransferase [Solirubrobacteraceae bacterium]|jgi:glycosyltransferase involved in cell wall biosynthesis|nr:glycosyltransferase [Solirubrobacteraceae bacterium]